LLQQNQDLIQSNIGKQIVLEIIDITPSMVTPIYGAENGVET
jgi:hypothetical protein